MNTVEQISNTADFLYNKCIKCKEKQTNNNCIILIAKTKDDFILYYSIYFISFHLQQTQTF